MSLQRGTYGIEYDERQGLPLRKFWGVFALIPVAGLFFLLFRGCGGEHPREAEGDDGLGQVRYRIPGVEAPRERPSLLKHFLNLRRQPEALDTAKKGADAAVPGKDSDWLLPEGKPLSAAKVQSQEVRKLLDQAAAREEQDDLVGMRLLLLQVLLRRDADEVRAFVERKIGTVNATLAFANRPAPEKVKHRVVAGDLISKIAKKYGNTQDFILKANGIDKPERLRIGREVWVLEQPQFELTVFKKSGSAVLTLNGQFFKKYPLGISQPERVPAGTYAIRAKGIRVSAPVSEGGGARWISLEATGATPQVRGLGLHGAWSGALPERGLEAGRVCFRNADIEELYTLLPEGAAVNIAE